jgi:hypothetical protein
MVDDDDLKSCERGDFVVHEGPRCCRIEDVHLGRYGRSFRANSFLC